jgi:hypothetical protein
MRYCFTLLALCLTVSLYAQHSNLLPERAAYKLSLPVKNGSVYEMDVPASPFVQQDNLIQIYPGETLYLEAEENDSHLKLTSVKKIENPEKTITVRCFQNKEHGEHQGMFLEIRNPFKKDLVYSARMLLMNKKWVDTDVLPVSAGLLGIETWPDVVLSFALYDWKVGEK